MTMTELDFITITLVLIFFTGVRIMSVLTDIKAAQAATLAALNTIATQQEGTIGPADAQQLLADEQANQAAAEALIKP